MNRYTSTAEKVDDLVRPGTLRKKMWRIPEIDMTDYDRYTVTTKDLKRIDLIAYRMYGDVNFWWVVAVMNNISNPLRDLVAGVTLRIPKIAAITEALAFEEGS